MMEYRGKGEAFVSSAGILPAAAGMLPASKSPQSRAVWKQRYRDPAELLKLSGNMPDRASKMLALPNYAGIFSLAYLSTRAIQTSSSRNFFTRPM
jgi:hypothetical protein